MPTRVYDSSQITKRAGQKAIAGSFLNRLYPPSGPPQPSFGRVAGVYDNSILNAVKTGHMTEYTRYPTCIGVSVGCPCPTTPIIPPGAAQDLTLTAGSIIVSWSPPKTGTAPYKYRVTPYLNGVALEPITTFMTSHTFTSLEEWKPYTFTVCAINDAGQGPTVPSSTYFIAPPNQLSTIMKGIPISDDPIPSLTYVINAGLDTMLQYVASINLGPTKGSRFMYVWITSVVGAWNWVRSDTRITGIHDTWNWSTNKATNHLSDSDSIIWLCSVIDYITPFFITSGYKSIYNCPSNVISRVKDAGEWAQWTAAWQTWFEYRQADGFVTASTTQPTSSANWSNTIIVDGTTINDISSYPAPHNWTRLTVQGKKQNYLTYTWDSVLSSCLTEENEEAIQNSVTPLSGVARDTEIDQVKDITANLTDEQKIIAEFWAGGPGTVSPPLMFIWLWKEYIRTLNTISCPTVMYSLQDLAIHLFEGARVTWRLKAAHMEDRPIQEIRRRYTGQMIQSWNGQVDGSQWTPYQENNFITPPFADFPSGHSHFSKAFALTMNKWFSQNIEKNTTFYDKETLICPLFTTNNTSTYGDFIIPVGASIIESGTVPSSPITLSFTKWDEMADQAGLSRLYGGIHAITAHNSSQQTAIQVDTYINSTWNIQTETS